MLARLTTVVLLAAAVAALPNELAVEGNEAFSDAEVTTAAFAEGKLNVAAVERFYLRAGYLNVAVSSPESEGRPRRLVIAEGPRYRVATVAVDNDSPLSRDEVRAFIPLGSGDAASPPALHEGLRDILAALADRGYIRAVAEYKITPAAADRVTVNVAVRAGERYTAGDIKFVGVDAGDETVLRAELETRAGKPLRERTLARDILRVIDFYRARGYPNAATEPGRFTLAEPYREIDFTLAVDAGEQVTVRAIEIVGNRRTRDAVIRRELRIFPGDPYDIEKLRASARRIYNLKYFEAEPTITLADAEAGLLRLEVAERRTYRLSGALAYEPVRGEATGLIGEVETNLANLGGTGREAEARYRHLSAATMDAGGEFYEPWIGGIDLFAQPRASYRERVHYRKASGELSLGTHPALDLTVAGGGGFDRVWEENASRKVKVFAWAEYDSRDFFGNPRRGWLMSARAELGVKQYLSDDFRERVPRLELDAWRFWPTTRNQVLAARARAQAFFARRAAVDEYYPLGGHADLRGFKEEQFYADRQALATVEYRFLTGRESRLFVFADAAYHHLRTEQLLVEGIDAGYGAGFRARTPVGTYGVDYGLAVGAGPLDGKIHISITEEF